MGTGVHREGGTLLVPSFVYRVTSDRSQNVSRHTTPFSLHNKTENEVISVKGRCTRERHLVDLMWTTTYLSLVLCLCANRTFRRVDSSRQSTSGMKEHSLLV